MKFESKIEPPKPAPFSPIVVTVTLQSVKEALMFRCLFGNGHKHADDLAESVSGFPDAPTATEVRNFFLGLQEAVPYSIYEIARRG